MKFALILAALGIGMIVYGVATTGLRPHPESAAAAGPSQATLEKITRKGMAGKPVYERSCASCHGAAGQGSKQGPPLVHKTYNPGHHADEAFRRAIRSGVKQHHWYFGDMPERPEVTDTEIPKIVRYVRELQEANGIFYERHRM